MLWDVCGGTHRDLSAVFDENRPCGMDVMELEFRDQIVRLLCDSGSRTGCEQRCERIGIDLGPLDLAACPSRGGWGGQELPAAASV